MQARPRSQRRSCFGADCGGPGRCRPR